MLCVRVSLYDFVKLLHAGGGIKSHGRRGQTMTIVYETKVGLEFFR